VDIGDIKEVIEVEPVEEPARVPEPQQPEPAPAPVAEDSRVKEYTTIDKTGWGDGPWSDEPDKRQWVDETTGLDCLIVRNVAGALCGYVGVGPDHPWHGVDYGDCTAGCGEPWCGHSPDSLVDVHGGLTYSAGCQEHVDPAKGICHVPEPGRPDDVFWYGFDCAHAGDVLPTLADVMRFPDSYDVYRDFDYVTWQVELLAVQLEGVA